MTAAVRADGQVEPEALPRAIPGPPALVLELPGRIGTARWFDPAWCVVADPRPERDRVTESVFAVADGQVGTRGLLEEAHADATAVRVAGVYTAAEPVTEALLALPSWVGIPLADDVPTGLRVLDLRDGVVHRWVPDGGHGLCTARFACLDRPGTGVLVAQLDRTLLGDVVPVAHLEVPGTRPAADGVVAGLARGDGVAVFRATSGGGVVRDVATAVDGDGERIVVSRLAVHRGSAHRMPPVGSAVRALGAARDLGPARLLDEQRAAWARRWAERDVEVAGDIEATRALRLGIFHLTQAVRRAGAAGVPARGLTGPAYAGHVFWDMEVFVLPFLAAVDPAAAASALEYRRTRLGAARDRAAADGRSGARFPWESGRDGTDVTPRSGVTLHGDVVPIRTGDLEEHVTADVAWGAWQVAAWSGDWGLLDGPAGALVVETARYWASRVRWDARGRAHIDGVTGPDEYHEVVDDNAFTNLMARWNLERAAELVERAELPDPGRVAEAEGWRRCAAALVDGYDPVRRVHEQFSGFDLLEPLVTAELGRPPLAADLVLGSERTAASQIIKQADVLMAHLLVPGSLPSGSLEADLDRYLPHTAHGSSLSPAVHATLMARVGRLDEALELFRVACAVDVDDLTGTTAGGVHLATMGGLWQAVVLGFLGVSISGPDDPALVLAPRLPEAWTSVRVRLRWHGARLRLEAQGERVHVLTDRAVTVSVHGSTRTVEPPGGWVG